LSGVLASILKFVSLRRFYPLLVGAGVEVLYLCFCSYLFFKESDQYSRPFCSSCLCYARGCLGGLALASGLSTLGGKGRYKGALSATTLRLMRSSTWRAVS